MPTAKYHSIPDFSSLCHLFARNLEFCRTNLRGSPFEGLCLTGFPISSMLLTEPCTLFGRVLIVFLRGWLGIENQLTVLPNRAPSDSWFKRCNDDGSIILFGNNYFIVYHQKTKSTKQTKNPSKQTNKKDKTTPPHPNKRTSFVFQ